MDRDWERLAKLVRARRKQLRMTQAQLGAESGTSEPTVRHLEAQVRQTFSDDTLIAISKALGWSPDSIDRVLAGNEPVVDAGLAGGYERERDEDIRELLATVAALERRVAELERSA